MVLDILKGHECRYAVDEELEEMYALLQPLVCDETEHKNILEMNERKLRKYLRYAIKTKQAIIVTDGTEITSAYAGDDRTIMYMGTKGTNLVSTVLLMHTVLNRIHNRFAESAFLTVNAKQRKAWSVTALGEEAVEIDNFGIGKVKVSAKAKLETLYGVLKDKL